MIEILNRYTNAVIYRPESAETVREAMVAAVRSGANLCEANLCEANLCEANLCEAYLRGANLREANLRGAYLRGADLGELRARYQMPDAAALREAVALKLEKNPELHNQGEWGDGSADPDCGTACCVAGWACHLGGGDRNLGVSTAATLLLWADGLPMPDFSGGAKREDIIAALRATK